MIRLLAIFVAGFASVFLLGFQSRNVNHGNYRWAAATSFVIAIAQAGIWRQITRPDAGWLDSLVYGLAGMLGITSSMYVHARFVAKKGRTP